MQIAKHLGWRGTVQHAGARPRPLRLSGLQPVAKGKWHAIFEHPEDAGVLVKVQRQDTLDRVAAKAPRGLRALVRYYYSIVGRDREMREYRRAHGYRPEERQFLQAEVGLLDTDLGVGLAVRAVRTRAGALAPTLGDLLRDGRDPAEWREPLEAFLRWYAASPVVTRDFRPQNIVFDEVGRHFVLIDGLGDKTLVPFRSWIPRFNRKGKTRSARLMRDAVMRHLAGHRAAAQ